MRHCSGARRRSAVARPESFQPAFHRSLRHFGAIRGRPKPALRVDGFDRPLQPLSPLRPFKEQAPERLDQTTLPLFDGNARKKFTIFSPRRLFFAKAGALGGRI